MMERPVLSEEEMANELDRVASICNTTRLAASARYGAELIRKSRWRKPEECPENCLVVAACKSGSGDEESCYFTRTAWKHGNVWIADNQIIADEVYAWQFLTEEIPDYKEFADKCPD
jgi:MoaA/NifB/PqqE/SkfB family radical SAM enzyme